MEINADFRNNIHESLYVIIVNMARSYIMAHSNKL